MIHRIFHTTWSPRAAAKKTNIKVYGKFYYLFCFNLPGKKCILPTHISILNDAQLGDFSGANQSQDIKYSESELISPGGGPCHGSGSFYFLQKLRVISPDLTTIDDLALVKFCSPHCSGCKFS